MIKTKINFEVLTDSKIKLNINIIETKIIIYFTVCCINNYIDVFDKIIDYIYSSKLYDLIYEIRLIIFNKEEDLLLQKYYSHQKIKIIKTFKENFGNNTEHYTLNILQEDSKVEDFYVLYLHTKGVSARHQNENMQNKINDWVNYLLYFNIYHYKYILDNIESYSAIGVDLNGYGNTIDTLSDLIKKEGLCGPNYPYLFGGNFWWSKSEYIKNINKCEEIYPAAEVFITRGKLGKFLCLWNSKVNFYEQNYSKKEYESKELQCYTSSNL